MTESEKAYTAGIFGGEGCISMRGHHLTIKVTQKNPEVLYWLREKFGFGSVLEYHRPESASIYTVHGRENQIAFLQTIYPFAIVRKRQIKLAYHFALTKGKRGVWVTPEVRARRDKLTKLLHATRS